MCRSYASCAPPRSVHTAAGRPGRGRGGGLGHADAAAEQAERGPGAAAARDGQPRVVLGAARRREDLERRRAAERLGPVQRRQVPQGRGPEGGRDLGRARAVVAEARVEDRARGRVVGAVADAPELEQGVVARLRGRVEQPVARDAQRARREERVEDGHAHVGHAGGAPRERHLVEVPQLALHEEEEEVALAVRRHARRQQPARRREARAPRQRRADLGVALVLEGDPVLAADQHAARAVAAAGRRREHVGRARDGLAPAARHVVEAEVELVVGEHLLGVARRLAARVGVGVAVVELERREARVVEADVERDDVEDDAARLVRLERRADGGRAGGVAVQRVHELRALDRGDHDRAAARVGREVLAGHRAPAARLAERLAVDARPGPLAASKRSTVSVPASDATATSSVAAPVGRTAQSARTQLNVAVLATVARRPVASSGRSSSSAPPCRATTTSCARPAENEPKAAATTAAGGFKVNCTKCIVRSLRAPGLRDARSGHGYRTGAGQDRGRGLHPPL